MAQHPRFPARGPTVDDLPTYLGFGVLDQRSVRFEEGCLTATYSDEHDRVYGVRWNPWDEHFIAACLLKSYWRGREIGRSGGPDLQKAFFYSWHGADKSWKDQRFIDLSKEIIGADNVYFVFPRPENVFFPAGLLFRLRQPILERYLPAWQAFKRTLEFEGEPEPRLVVYREGPGSVLHLADDGDMWSEEVLVVDLIVPLARLIQAVKDCILGGIVPSGKHYRLAVCLAEDRICWQAGDTRQERAFAVVHDDEVESARAAAPSPLGAASMSRTLDGVSYERG